MLPSCDKLPQTDTVVPSMRIENHSQTTGLALCPQWRKASDLHSAGVIKLRFVGKMRGASISKSGGRLLLTIFFPVVIPRTLTCKANKLLFENSKPHMPQAFRRVRARGPGTSSSCRGFGTASSTCGSFQSPCSSGL